MNRIEIPTLLFWENGNSWYGSLGDARFFIQPEAPEGQEKRLSVRLWKGPLAMELSEIITSAAFPVTEEGLSQTTAWLEKHSAQLESSPAHPGKPGLRQATSSSQERDSGVTQGL